MISRIALAYEKHPPLHAELVQEILLALWRALPAFRGESTLKTFVGGIAYRRAVTHVRRVTRTRPEPEAGLQKCPEPLPDEQLAGTQLRERLTAAVGQLPAPQREVVVLMLEGFGMAEIGEALGISTNAAALKAQRARANLRRLMEDGA